MERKTGFAKYNKDIFIQGLKNIKTNKYVICFGQTKAGKSSFINLLDHKKKARISKDVTESTKHGMDFSIMHPIEGNRLCNELFGGDIVIMDSRGFSDSGGVEDSATTLRIY